MTTLGEILKTCRDKAELSQEELAYKMNRTQACISKFEHNHKTPDINTFTEWMQLTDCKEVGVAFLFGVEGMDIINKILNKEDK